MALRAEAPRRHDEARPSRRRRRFGRFIASGFGAGLLFFGAIQLVPYGHNHTNPPVVQEPAWAGAQTRALVVRACYDCHSNQTIWPWYSNVAPMSWLIQRDVEGGRSELNFSTWGRSDSGSGDAAEALQSGQMPPWYYAIMHPHAKLSPAERAALIRGLQNTH